MSPYLLILINSFQATLLVPTHSEYGWFAARAFGRHDMPALTVAAVLGATLAMCANYGLGRWVARTGPQRLHINEALYERLCGYFRYIALLLLFPPLPFAALLAAVCGIFRVRFLALIAVVMLGRIGYYGYYLLH